MQCCSDLEAVCRLTHSNDYIVLFMQYDTSNLSYCNRKSCALYRRPEAAWVSLKLNTSQRHLPTQAAALPRPRPAPRAMPLPPLPPLVVPRGIPPPLAPALGMPLPLPAVFDTGAGVAGVWNLDDILLLGGLSTKEVSVVRKVASMSPSGPCELLKWGLLISGWFCGRLNDSATGACRSTLEHH